MIQHDVAPDNRGIAEASSKIANCLADFTFPSKLNDNYDKFARLLGGICVNADNDERQVITQNDWEKLYNTEQFINETLKKIDLDCSGENRVIIPLGWIGDIRGINLEDYNPGSISVYYYRKKLEDDVKKRFSQTQDESVKDELNKLNKNLEELKEITVKERKTLKVDMPQCWHWRTNCDSV